MDKTVRTEYEEERHEYATALSASGISNEEFHRALAQFDREWEHHEEFPEWELGDPVPEGFRIYDGDGESGPCEPYLEPIQYEHCYTCDSKQQVMKTITVIPADPTAAYVLACGHTVI